MVVKNEFWLVKTLILRVKRHKTCKIGFKTWKPVKSVKPGQTCIKSSQLIKKVKTGPSSRFLLKWKTMWTALSAFPFPLFPVNISIPLFCFTLSPFPPSKFARTPNHQRLSRSRNQTEKWEICSTHQQRLWFYMFWLSTHQNVLGQKKVRIYKDAVIAWELFPCCSVF